MSAAAAWYRDPAVRHEWRYWDGLSWTAHVADHGQVGDDPDVDHPPPAEAAAAPAHHAGFLERRRLAKAEEQYEKELAEWQERLEDAQSLLQTIDDFAGVADGAGLLLRTQEALFGKLDGAALVEAVSQGGEWVGRSQGLSFPIASIGHSTVRYRVGASHGHFVRAAPTPTAIDRGAAYISNQRVAFVGSKQTREVLFSKLIGFTHGATSSSFSTSNRQKPVTIAYGEELHGWFVARFSLALAHFQHTTQELRSEAATEMARVESERPVPPPHLTA